PPSCTYTLSLHDALPIWPYGFFGRAEAIGGTHAVGIASRKPLPGRSWILLVIIAALAAFPLLADAYLLKVATEILIFALFAFSLDRKSTRLNSSHVKISY